MSKPNEDTVSGSDNEHKEIIEEIVEEESAVPESEESNEELSIEEQLEKALEEATKFRDVALRAEAEMQNVRRRAERDVEHAYKFGLEKFIQNILPVVDGIEKAVEATEQAGVDEKDPVVEGFRLCQKLMLDVLGKQNVEVVDPIGAPFDPNEHEAMSMVENPDMEPNSVFAVVQKGYKLNSRLVRPAMVMVSKAPADQ
jgi:molecular chaperone GrpE